MRRPPSLATLACALLLAACAGPTYFSDPVSPPGAVDPDPRLSGVWNSRLGVGTIQIAIEPTEMAGGAPALAIGVSFAGVSPDPAGDGGLLGYWRLAHASEVEGRIYYNIRGTREVADVMVLLKGANPRPLPDDTWHVPAHLRPLYWIARTEFDADGQLWIKLIEIGVSQQLRRMPASLRPYLETRGQGRSYWQERCGKACSSGRVHMSSAALTEMIRAVPDEDLFSATAGPFVRSAAAFPEFQYDDFWFD